MPTALAQINESIFVEGKLQTIGVDYIIDDTRYVIFDVAPPVGVNNLMIVICTHQASNSDIIHAAGTIVYDAGGTNQLPTGAYSWQPARQGMLSIDNDQSRWLLTNAPQR